MDELAGFVESTDRPLDALINTAAAYYDVGEPPSSVSMDSVRAALEVNLRGAWWLSAALVPLLERHGFGCRVNLFSGST